MFSLSHLAARRVASITYAGRYSEAFDYIIENSPPGFAAAVAEAMATVSPWLSL